ncbi:hypothetical protein HPP92_007542 [Vanilla planifolia]|uniref:Uncharacterized protein n=1 Tax=Vanilla planifolia TaxID=51239 RepID=A0A835RKG6_VANPL|nr:hypothetical protein HPP92_007542 [Vanilla planifolia]
MYWAAGRLTEKWKRSFSSQMRRRKGWRRQQGPRPPSPPARSQSPTIDILFSLESVSGVQTDRISKKMQTSEPSLLNACQRRPRFTEQEDDQLGADLTLENTAAGFWNFSQIQLMLRRRV